MAETIPVTMVNHVAIDIAAPADSVWRKILDQYVEAKKFRALGVITPIDQPAAILGGYRMRIEHDGAVDERIVHITERDDTARRLSVVADYLSFPGGMLVYATYQAHEIGDGARFTIDCHSRIAFEMPANGGRDALAAAVADGKSQADGHLIAYIESVKAQLEGVG